LNGANTGTSLQAPPLVRPSKTGKKQILKNRKIGEVKRLRPAKCASLLDKNSIMDRLGWLMRDGCCASSCVERLSIAAVFEARKAVHFGKSEGDVLEWTRSTVQQSTDPGGVVRYSFQAQPVCRTTWMFVNGIGKTKLAHAMSLLRAGTSFTVHGNVDRRVPMQFEYTSTWLRQHILFELCAEQMPTGTWLINDFQVERML
jgi:hypothetical protein